MHTLDGHGNINTDYSEQMDDKTWECEMRTTNDFSKHERVLNLLKPDSVMELLQQKHTYFLPHRDFVNQEHVGRVEL